MRNNKHLTVFSQTSIYLGCTILSLLLSAKSSVSQELPSCFFVEPNGNTINLDGTSLCPPAKKKKVSSNPSNLDSNVCREIKSELNKKYCNIAANLVTSEKLAKVIKVSATPTKTIDFANTCHEKTALTLNKATNYKFIGRTGTYEIFSGVYVVSGRVYSENESGVLNRQNYVCVFSHNPSNEDQQLSEVNVSAIDN